MLLNDLSGNWRVEIENEVFSKEDIDNLPNGIRDMLLNKAVEKAITIEDVTYYKFTNKVDLDSVNVRKDVLKKLTKDLPQPFVYIEPQYQPPMLLRVLINILIWLLKMFLVLLSFPLQILSLLTAIGASFITIIFGFLGFAALCLFLFAPDTRGDIVPLVLAFSFGGVSVVASYIPEWIGNAVLFLLELKNTLRYI